MGFHFHFNWTKNELNLPPMIAPDSYHYELTISVPLASSNPVTSFMDYPAEKTEETLHESGSVDTTGILLLTPAQPHKQSQF